MYAVATNTTNAKVVHQNSNSRDMTKLKESQDPAEPIACDSDSVASTPTVPTKGEAGVPLRTQSRSEEIRARLRDKEKRLSNLVRASSNASKDGSTSGFLTQYAQVEDNLKKVENEKSALEQELERLRNSTTDDDFLMEKMAGIQEGFDKQVEKINELQQEVLTKELSIQRLRDELVHKLRRIVELEFDLETHQVHYTNYAAEQFKLGEDALEEIKNHKEIDLGGHESVGSLGSTASKVSPKRAQKLISKLLTDLDDLEARYKNDTLNSGVKMERMTLQMDELLTKIEMLETRLKEEEGSAASESKDSTPGVGTLDDSIAIRKRAETYEARCTILEKKIASVEAQMKDESHQYEVESRQLKLTIERLTLEIDSLTGSPQGKTLQSKIRDAYSEVSKLEAEGEIKDRQLATLKKEITNLRLRNIRGNGSPNNNDLDSDLLQNDDGDRAGMQSGMQTTFGSGGGDNGEAAAALEAVHAQMAKLRNQLHESQQILVKKDQELVIERAKSASTAAGLLARITELSAKQHRMDHPQSKRSSTSSVMSTTSSTYGAAGSQQQLHQQPARSHASDSHSMSNGSATSAAAATKKKNRRSRFLF